MSTLTIVLIGVAILVIVLFIGGLIAVRARDREEAPHYDEHLREADQALERARAEDRGWDPALLEAAVRDALARRTPASTSTSWCWSWSTIIRACARTGRTTTRMRPIRRSEWC